MVAFSTIFMDTAPTVFWIALFQMRNILSFFVCLYKETPVTQIVNCLKLSHSSLMLSLSFSYTSFLFLLFYLYFILQHFLFVQLSPFQYLFLQSHLVFFWLLVLSPQLGDIARLCLVPLQVLQFGNFFKVVSQGTCRACVICSLLSGTVVLHCLMPVFESCSFKYLVQVFSYFIQEGKYDFCYSILARRGSLCH